MTGATSTSKKEKPLITVETTVERPVAWVWTCFTDPAHVIHWNFASEDWHCPTATNTLETGGSFNYRMAAKDGSFGFDFEGTFIAVVVNRHLAYTIGDRSVTVDFVDLGTATKVVETFEAEAENSLELQRGGWQAILDNFKKHAESSVR